MLWLFPASGLNNSVSWLTAGMEISCAALPLRAAPGGAVRNGKECEIPAQGAPHLPSDRDARKFRREGTALCGLPLPPSPPPPRAGRRMQKGEES